MLSCKEFVEQLAKIIDNEELTLGQKLNNKLHLFFCHHCKTYLKQAKITVAVAKKLDCEPPTSTQIEQSIAEMKGFSVSQE
ncbi:MAG: anti-sigma factor [Gammaproteobacteria bacterium]|nr:anti-sigma factor [Gammaproteobacteria bacterium]